MFSILFRICAMSFPNVRLRRLRIQPRLRDLIRETELSPNDSIQPLFIREGVDIKNPLVSMPGQYQFSLDNLIAEINGVMQS